jgi:hypothetical protein
MKLITRLLLAALMLPVLAFGQSTARLQVIHNAPLNPNVDIYVNGTKLLDNFAFRTATPYIDVPAGVVLNVGVAGFTSATARDTIANFPVTLTAGKRYVVVAHGIVGNATRPFRLAVTDLGAETADAPANVGLAFFHGTPDAPNVDILTGGNVVFGNTAYGTFARGTQPYANVPANATYQLTVTPAGAPTTVVARYEGNLGFWQGKTAVVFASGLLSSQDPENKFEAWVALSNGGTFALKTLQAPAAPAGTNTANIQFIHNSPTPTVDIYANGVKLLDDFAFRTATPYIQVPAGVTINVAVAPATSTSAANAITTIPVRLDSGKTYIAVAYGIVGDAQRPFGIALSDAGRMASTNPNNVDINFFHGSPDAPAVDILAGANVVFKNTEYSKFSTYISVPAAAIYRLGVTPTNNNSTVVARYDLNLDFWKGKTAVVIATGFLTGTPTPFKPAFEPYVVLSGGGTFPLRAVTGLLGDDPANLLSRNVQKGETAISPNPASDNVNIQLNLTKDGDASVQILNLAGQVVKNERYGRMNKGMQWVTINTNDLQSGYYMVRIESADGIQTEKLMIAQ